MAQQFVQKKTLLYESAEKNDDATSSRDHEGENKTVEWKTNPEEGHICRGKFHRRELDPPAVFISGFEVPQLTGLRNALANKKEDDHRT